MARQSVLKFPKEFDKQVREACKHYDKPKRIGKLAIASMALQAVLLEEPNHPIDGVGRGEALQHVIAACLHELRPPNMPLQAPQKPTLAFEVYVTLYLYLQKRDPFTNREIANMNTYLDTHHHVGISRGTYHNRLKKEALSQMSYALSSYLAQRTTWLEPIPSPKGFVGREEELLYYGRQLKEEGLVVLQGVGGIGKTTLGAELALKIRATRPVCWLTIRVGVNDTPKALLYGWAAFLAQQDFPQLWAFMRATANEQTPLQQYFPLLSQGLAKVQPLLCLDNLESIPDQEETFSSLLEIVQKEGDANLLLISQRRPPLSLLGDYALLSGLSSTEVQLFMAQRGMELTEEQAELATTYTLGNARLLDLWAAHMRMNPEQNEAERINSLATLRNSQAASHFLATEIIAALTPAQQRAASLLALSRDPLDEYLLLHPLKGVDSLSYFEIQASDYTILHQQGLISRHLGHQWRLSPLLKAPLTQKITSDDRIDFHQWLSDLSRSQGNIIEAAYHTIECEEPEQAILWLAEQKPLLIKQGYALAMNSLLKSIQADDLSAPVRENWRDLRGNLALLQGDYQAAQAEADASLHEATSRRAQAQAEWQRGVIAKARGKATQAADHYQEALRLLAIKEISLETWLHRELAWTALEQNDIEDAKEELEKAEMALHNMFGIVYRQAGNVDKALKHYEQALTIAQKHKEVRQLIRIRNNLATIYRKKNQVQRAITTYQENLPTIEEIGERIGKAITLLNLGNCYKQLGKKRTAVKHIAQALPIFSDLGDAKGQLLAHLNLAEAHLQLKQLDAAQEHAEIASKAAYQKVSQTDYAEALRIYAEVFLAQGHLTRARSTAEQALDARRLPNAPDSFFDPYYAKLTCETLTRIHTALGNTAEAEQYEMLAKELGRKIKG